MPVRRGWLALFPILVVIAACATLPEVRSGTCGNGAVEPGEDCDTFVPSGMRCRPASEVAACRYACASGTSAPSCPAGWGCGSDGVCRRPAGTFRVASRVEQSADRIELADFDGDGVLDVLANVQGEGFGGSAPRVVFLDAQGRSPNTWTLRYSVSSVHAVSLSTTGPAAIVLASTPPSRNSHLSGVATLLGTSERDFLALPYDATANVGARARMLGIHGAIANPNGVAALLFLAIGGNTAAISVVTASAGSVPVGMITTPFEQFVIGPIAANVIERDSPCEEAILATSTAVTALEPCTAQGELTSMGRVTELLALPEPIRTLVPVDLNGDAHIDLLMSTSDANYVAFGAGDGTFHADPSATGAVGLARLELADNGPPGGPGEGGAPGPPVIPGAILAAGVLDGGRVGLVGESAVLLARGGAFSAGTYRLDTSVVFARFTGTWGTAIVADVNRDGNLDMIGGSSASSDLDVMLGAGGGVFSKVKLSTRGGVVALTAADVDGDGVRDIVSVESGGTAQVMRLAYGRALSAPETPVVVANLASVRQLVGVAFDPLSPAESISIVSAASTSGDDLSVFISEGARTPISPVTLLDGTTSGGLPLVLAVGHFTATSTVDVGLLAMEAPGSSAAAGPPSSRLWAITSVATRSHDVTASAQLSDFAAPPTDPASQWSQLAPAMAAADLDGDRLDELYVLGANETRQVVLVTARAKDKRFVQGVSLVLDGACALELGSALLPLDVDRDGHLDLVVLCRPLAGPSLLEVLWNDGAGGLSPSHATRIPLGEQARAIGAIGLDADRGRELVFVTGGAVLAVRAGPSRELSTRTIIEIGGSSIASGDIDVDGLEDLAIGDAKGITLLFGEARNP